MSVKKKIAVTIKRADKSYFFEDYGKQASAVMRMLDKNGYVIVPKEPDEDMIKAGDSAIENGKVDPTELVKMVYAAMTKSGKCD